jgi:hypothetical protein
MEEKHEPRKEMAPARPKANLANLSDSDVAAIRDDLIRSVIERAKSVETDAHSSHGNVHSSIAD